MPTSKFLDYEVTLILAKYGRNALLRSLANKLKLSTEQIEGILEALQKEKPPSRSVNQLDSLGNKLSELTERHPEKAEVLRSLCARLENKTFLPELRDVKRFLQQHGRPLSSKSRAQSLSGVLDLLSELSVTELETLNQTIVDTKYSSLGVISDEIMRPR